MFKVETYNNPVEFFNTLEMRYDELHITSIPTLAMHLKKLAKAKDNILMWNVWIYHHFYRAAYPRWNSINKQLRQKQIMRKLLNEFPHENKQTQHVLSKQVDELTKAFRFWIEIGMTEFKTEANDTELEKAYSILYKHFLEEPECQHMIKELSISLEEKDLIERLNTYNKRYLKNKAADYQSIKYIYVYCMDLLEPARVKFLKKLEEAGYEVIFRIPDDKDYPNLHECWQNLYEKLVPREVWQVLQETGKTSMLQCFLEGKMVEDLPKSVIKYHEQSEPTLFKRYLREHPMEKQEHLGALNREYVACMTDEINEYFRDEIYHKEEIKHFYDTPLGKFINIIYGLKKVGEDDFRLDYASFMDLMVSGLVTIKGRGETLVNGNRAIGLLSDLESYMDGVKSLNEIVKRMETYRLLNSMSDEFEELGRSKADRNRVKRYLQNPLRALGYINHNKYDLTSNQLYELTLKLKEIIHELLVNTAPHVALKAHLDKVRAYLEESRLLEVIKSSSKEALQDDFSQDKSLQEKSVQDEGTSEKVVGNEALAKAYDIFNQVIKERLQHVTIEQPEDMKDYIGIMTKLASAEEQGGNVLLVKSFEHLPALCVNGVKEIYLCDLSTKHMNAYIESRSQIGHLMNLSDLKKYVRRLPEGAHREELLQLLSLGEVSSYHVQNFIKYNLTSLLTYYEGELHLGWIKNMAPYDTEWYLLGIIRNLSTVEKVEEKDRLAGMLDDEVLEKEDMFTKGTEVKEVEKDIDIEYIARQLSPLAWRDLKSCSKRFYLANLLNHYPVYLEEFTQREYFAQLCRLLEDTQGGKEAVRELVFPLFPQWSDALKQNLVETHYGKKLGNYVLFDNVHFPEDMLSIQYFRATSQDIKEMRGRTLTDKTNKLRKWLGENQEGLQTSPSKGCYLCPYQMVCQEGRLAIERENK